MQQEGVFLDGVKHGTGLGFHPAGAVRGLSRGEVVSRTEGILSAIVKNAFGGAVAQVIRPGD